MSAVGDVIQPVSGLCESGTDKVTCIVMDADHRRIYHSGRPVPPHASTEVLLNGAEPQQPETVPVLDLVRQYGAQIANRVEAIENHSDESVFEHRAEALFDRIAALLPQHAEQARTTAGDLIWQHIPCGWAHPWHPEATPGTGPDGDPVGCHKPGPWRPLFVGADPAPEQPASRALVTAWKTALAERDDARANLTRALQARGEFLDETIRLRAEIAELRLALARSEANVAHWTDMAEGRTAQPAEPGPLVLTLPEVPGGTVALVGRTSADRYVPEGNLLWWRSELNGRVCHLGTVLREEGSVTVELAPPREPRTWPALKPGPSPVDLPQYVTVQGWGSYGLRSDGLYANTDGYPDDVYRASCHTFDSLRALGDVTEVLDDEAGTR